MAERSRAGIEMDFVFGKGGKTKFAPSPDLPLRMLVLGDFGGHASRGEIRSLGELRPLRVDLDKLPSVVAKISPAIQIRLGSEPPFTIGIESLDSFHPDRLFSGLDFFAPMRELRRQLQDPKTFALAAAVLGSVKSPSAAVPDSAIAEHNEDLQRLLGKPSASAPAARATSAVEDLIRQAAAPHIVNKADPRQDELLASVDGMTGELMRAVLHDPGFQGVEAAWRGLDRLVRALELDESTRIFALDISRDELVADFARSGNLADSAMYRLLVEHAGDTPWSLIVDCDRIGRTQQDAALLARLGTLAQEAGAAVVAGTDIAAVSAGFASLEDERAWTALRGSPAASVIAMTAPSVLLRLPYGQATDPTERFVFTEQVTPPVLNRYLWGSGALAVAQLTTQAFLAAGGWDFSPGDESSLDDLPVHITRQDGESVQTPCAQAWLSESKMDALIKEGWSPLISAQGRGEIRLPRIQSIASPPTAWIGRWRND